MTAFFPVSAFFHHVFVVDITPSLCQRAQERVEALQLKNVTVHCMDACAFSWDTIRAALPESTHQDLEVALITLSYSLSMIPDAFTMVDHIQQLLSPRGLVGVADFGVPPKHCADKQRAQWSYLARWFWQIWFETDNVYLHPFRRDYLEHRFVTVKRVEGRNRFLGRVVQIPYYIWLGAQASVTYEESIMPHLDLDAPLTRSNSVPSSLVASQKGESGDKKNKISFDHVHGTGYQWRHGDIRPELCLPLSRYIYSFAFEDPQ